MSNSWGGNKASAGSKSKSNENVDVLLKKIEDQEVQLTRYQTKFKDITHAYKSLLAEKQALEITIKALKTKNHPGITGIQAQTSSTTNLKSSSSASLSDMSEAEQQSTKNLDEPLKMDEEASPEEKIAALTSNIQLVLDNKSKMEMNYQAEKKKLRADYDELKAKFEAFKLETQKSCESNELKIKELKSNLKSSHSDRENLTVELNNLIKIKQAEQENKVLSIQEENQSILINFRNENNELKLKIKNLTKQFDNKCEELIQRENEYKKLKSSYDEQLKEDETEFINLRNQLKEQSQSHEKRIGDLESNIAQLCATLAKYENNNNSDSNLNVPLAITTKLHQPPVINTKFTSPPIVNKSIENEMAELNLKATEKMDLDSAIEQISQLKSYIESTARDLNINFNFNEIWLQSGEFNVKLEKERQKELEKENEKLKEDNRHLKEEYEKFKIRTNYLIKSAKQLSKDSNPTTQETSEQQQQYQQQIVKLKEEIDELKKRLHGLHVKKDEEMLVATEKHEREVTRLRNELKQQHEKLENERLKTIGELELELKKQRERTLKLLAEKESEIEQLNRVRKTKLTAKSNDDSSLDSSYAVEPEASLAAAGNAMLDLDNSADDSQQSFLLYYNQQLAYKDTELNKLRHAKGELEYKLKQLADENTVDIDRLQNQIGILKDEIERCKLNSARDELNKENMEYVKNVVFQYMTTRDQNVKLSMINAIIQILKFTKSEKLKLQQVLHGGGSKMV